ncbi:hypothetical protein G6F65_016738 [Rhizopus arrhizus]|nr:hypothetical protein G6F65_016738 [Rhizopus arrhizus]
MGEEPGYDVMLQAFSGMISTMGEPGGSYARASFSPVDLGTGSFALSGILAALLARSQTGVGQYLDVSLLDTSLGLMSYMAQNYWRTGKIPQRMGTGHPAMCPYQAFRAADGDLMLGVGNDAQWQRFCAQCGAGAQLRRDRGAGAGAYPDAHRGAMAGGIEARGDRVLGHPYLGPGAGASTGGGARVDRDDPAPGTGRGAQYRLACAVQRTAKAGRAAGAAAGRTQPGDPGGPGLHVRGDRGDACRRQRAGGDAMFGSWRTIMTYLRYEVRDRVAEIHLCHAPVNALDVDMLDALIAALERANADAHVRAVLLASDLPGRSMRS